MLKEQSTKNKSTVSSLPTAEPFYLPLIRSEFTRRKNKNQAYSLSAFAKHLQLDQSLFSKILSGKKKISDRMASELLLRIGYAPEKIDGALKGFRFLEEEEFNFLSDWLPFAILELCKTKGFKSDVKWMAQRLGVHFTEVANGLARLEQFGYLTQDKKTGRLQLQRPDNNWANTTKTSMARKQLQKKFAEMSLQSIDEIPFQNRDHGSLTVAIDKKRLPELKEKLNQFRLELGEFLQRDPNLNEVYQITMTVFPLTKVEV